MHKKSPQTFETPFLLGQMHSSCQTISLIGCKITQNLPDCLGPVTEITGKYSEASLMMASIARGIYNCYNQALHTLRQLTTLSHSRD